MNSRMKFYQIIKNSLKHQKAMERRNLGSKDFIYALMLIYLIGLMFYILFLIAK